MNEEAQAFSQIQSSKCLIYAFLAKLCLSVSTPPSVRGCCSVGHGGQGLMVGLDDPKRTF